MAVQTEVAFHFNVADKGPYLCRLLRKVSQARMKALVCVTPDLARELDVLLWSFSQEEFLPHALIGDAEHIRSRSPVLIADAPSEWPQAEVLINGLPDLPSGLDRYQRVIEIVGTEAEDRQSARQRWKAYKERGYALQQHDVTGVAARGARA